MVCPTTRLPSSPNYPIPLTHGWDLWVRCKGVSTGPAISWAARLMAQVVMASMWKAGCQLLRQSVVSVGDCYHPRLLRPNYRLTKRFGTAIPLPSGPFLASAKLLPATAYGSGRGQMARPLTVAAPHQTVTSWRVVNILI